MSRFSMTMHLYPRQPGSLTGHINFTLTGPDGSYTFGLNGNDHPSLSELFFGNKATVIEGGTEKKMISERQKTDSEVIHLSKAEFNAKLEEARRFVGTDIDYDGVGNKYDMADGGHCLEFVQHILGSGSDEIKIIGDYFSKNVLVNTNGLVVNELLGYYARANKQSHPYSQPPVGFPGGAKEWFKNVLTGPLNPLTEAVNQAMEAFRALFNTAKNTPTPLILDLDGDGVETRGVTDGAWFDHGGDGFAEQTGWAGADDGILAWDRNGSGRIDSGAELFGDNSLLADCSKAANGFEALAALDDNLDGRIDSLDAAGVLSVHTDYIDFDLVDAQGNAHKQTGSFTRTDGTSAVVNDVWFQQDNMHGIAKPSAVCGGH